jgi:NADPH:quinone reductase-like Zn-dependent oxidoreductase
VPRKSYLTYLLKGVGVTGYRVDVSVAAHPDWFRVDLNALLELLQDGKIRPAIHRTFGLEQAARAHRELAGGRASGKILLTPQGD